MDTLVNATSTEQHIPVALGHLTAAEALAQHQDRALLAADIRYSHVTLTLATGVTTQVPALKATTLGGHLSAVAAVLDQAVEAGTHAAHDLVTTRGEIAALILQIELET